MSTIIHITSEKPSNQDTAQIRYDMQEGFKNVNESIEVISGSISSITGDVGDLSEKVETISADVLTKQDKLTAGSGISISEDNIISTTLDTQIFELVEELPTTGLPNKIYIVEAEETETGNIYAEYIYINNQWEKIGEFKPEIDLTEYAKIEYVDAFSAEVDVKDSVVAGALVEHNTKIFNLQELVDDNTTALSGAIDTHTSQITSLYGLTAGLDVPHINEIEQVSAGAFNDLNDKISSKVSSSYITNIWKGTEAEYETIATKDNNTFYIIVSE